MSEGDAVSSIGIMQETKEDEAADDAAEGKTE